MLSFSWLSLVVFLIAPVFAAPATIWRVDINRDPAPSPEDGPPAAAGALRDRSKLRYEIIGIVGAYVVWTLATIFLILFVGKKLRRKAQSSNYTLSMEILRSPKFADKDVPAGPLSPGKMASLKSWAMGGKHKSNKSIATNATESTIDARIVQEDRARNMDEMAKLYGAVLAHDEEKAASSPETSPSSPNNPKGSFHAAPQTFPTPPQSPQSPPELQHLRQQPPHPSEAPYYYPPPAQPEDISRATTRVNASPQSFAARHERNASSNSIKARPGRISVRGMSISEPTGPANLADSVGEDRSASGAAHTYTPGPAPPTPKHLPGLPMSPRLFNIEKGPGFPSHSRSTTAQSQELEGPRKRSPPRQLNLGERTEAGSTATLPFREMYSNQPTTAPATKTTFVEARKTIIGRHPATGVPQTPYSPYMPMTPMTPITPSRLYTKKDMKKQKKMEGMKVLSEDDMVKDDDDMWGS